MATPAVVGVALIALASARAHGEDLEARFREAFDTPAGYGFTRLDGPGPDSERVARFNAGYAWGGYASGDLDLWQCSDWSGVLQFSGGTNTPGAFVYTRFDAATFPAGGGAVTPSTVIDATPWPARVVLTLFRSAPQAVAVLIRDDEHWWQSSPMTTPRVEWVWPENPTYADVVFAFHGDRAVTWTRLDPIGAGVRDMDEVDDGGEGPLTTGLPGSPNLGAVQGLGVAIITGAETHLTIAQIELRADALPVTAPSAYQEPRPAQEPPLAPRWRPGDDRLFPRSYLAFYEGVRDCMRQPDLRFVDPARAVVAWGIDPVWAWSSFEPGPLRNEFRVIARRAVNSGALLSTNVDLITATPREYSLHPELLDARCRDAWGRPVVVPWFTELKDADNLAWWSCTNQPLYREHVRRRIRQGFEAGANALHIDDTQGSANLLWLGGCFCHACVTGFRDYLRGRLTPEELAECGVDDLSALDYGQFVRARVTGIQQLRTAYWRTESCPLLPEYDRYLRRSTAEFVAELKQYAKSINGPHTPLCTNSYNLGPVYAPFYEVSDYFGAEVNHLSPEAGGTAFDARGAVLEDVLVDEASAVLACRIAEALRKPLCITVPGANHGFLRDTKAHNLLRRWMALSYASGQHFMHTSVGWVEGWIEDGLFVTPPDLCAWAPGFVDTHRELFDGHEPVLQVGLFYDLERERYRGKSPVPGIARELANANISFGVVLGYDDWCDRRLAEADIMPYDIVIVPDPDQVNRQCRSQVRNWLDDGRATPWRGIEDLAGRIDPLLSLPESPPVWLLARAKPDDSEEALVVHVLNRRYDILTDAIEPQTAVRLRLSGKLIGPAGAGRTTYVAPGRDSQDVPARRRGDDVEVMIPRLDVWGVLRVERPSS